MMTTTDIRTISGQDVPAGTECVLLATWLEGPNAGLLLISVPQGVANITPYGVTS
jgi:hypothetical protein